MAPVEVHQTYPGEEVAVAVGEVHPHPRSVEEEGEGEEEVVRAVWSVDVVEGEGEVSVSTAPWTGGGVGAGCLAEVEARVSSCLAVAGKVEMEEEVPFG